MILLLGCSNSIWTWRYRRMDLHQLVPPKAIWFGDDYTQRYFAVGETRLKDKERPTTISPELAASEGAGAASNSGAKCSFVDAFWPRTRFLVFPVRFNHRRQRRRGRIKKHVFIRPGDEGWRFKWTFIDYELARRVAPTAVEERVD